ncbi:MAG: hypothetical protein SFY95_03060 [Planctomycetota bacterium]|nr:hypothetical protein [Planctomycetota bacterium]
MKRASRLWTIAFVGLTAGSLALIVSRTGSGAANGPQTGPGIAASRPLTHSDWQASQRAKEVRRLQELLSAVASWDRRDSSTEALEQAKRDLYELEQLALELAPKGHPQHAEYMRWIAKGWWDMGELSRASARYEDAIAAIQGSPAELELRRMLAQCYLLDAKPADAARVLEAAYGRADAIAENPRQAIIAKALALEHLAWAYKQLGQTDKELDVRLRVFRGDDAMPDTNTRAKMALGIAQAYDKLGQPEEARRWYEQITQPGYERTFPPEMMLSVHINAAQRRYPVDSLEHTDALLAVWRDERWAMSSGALSLGNGITGRLQRERRSAEADQVQREQFRRSSAMLAQSLTNEIDRRIAQDEQRLAARLLANSAARRQDPAEELEWLRRYQPLIAPNDSAEQKEVGRRIDELSR